MPLPTDSQDRKNVPLHSGCYAYFPDALAAVAALSKAGNDKHNPGQPLHWSREKSSDHADCIARHIQDAGKDFMGVSEADGGALHVVQAAWRALALAQVVLECKAAGKPFRAQGYPTGAEDAGWVAWAGGDECPVPDGKEYKVRFRSGEVSGRPALAAGYRWSARKSPYDIVAYKIL